MELARLLVDGTGDSAQIVFVDLSDGDLEDDFVCEGDVEGRGACASFVPGNARPGESAEEKRDVLLRKRGSPAQSPEVWDGDVSCHVSKFK